LGPSAAGDQVCEDFELFKSSSGEESRFCRS